MIEVGIASVAMSVVRQSRMNSRIVADTSAPPRPGSPSCVSKDLPFAQKRFCGAENIENAVTASAFRDGFGEDYGVDHCRRSDGRSPRAGGGGGRRDGEVVYSELVPEIAQEPGLRSRRRRVESLISRSAFGVQRGHVLGRDSARLPRPLPASPSRSLRVVGRSARRRRRRATRQVVRGCVRRQAARCRRRAKQPRRSPPAPPSLKARRRHRAGSRPERDCDPGSRPRSGGLDRPRVTRSATGSGPVAADDDRGTTRRMPSHRCPKSRQCGRGCRLRCRVTPASIRSASR